MLSCIIIEDQPLAQQMLQKYVLATDFLELKHVFADAIKASEYIKSTKVDLIFLDIHLPRISGIEFLKANPDHPKVILTTAFPDYALESYQYNVVDYLLKPISYERFLQAVAKLHAINKEEKATDVVETIVIKSGHEFIQIKTTDIVNIKSDSDYTEVFTTGKTYLSKDSLKEWLKKLNKKHFCQIHKSYIINLQHFKKISGNTVFLSNTTLPIGRVYKKDFISNYLE